VPGGSGWKAAFRILERRLSIEIGRGPTLTGNNLLSCPASLQGLTGGGGGILRVRTDSLGAVDEGGVTEEGVVDGAVAAGAVAAGAIPAAALPEAAPTAGVVAPAGTVYVVGVYSGMVPAGAVEVVAGLV
jgi:hypothetical protein